MMRKCKTEQRNGVYRQENICQSCGMHVSLSRWQLSRQRIAEQIEENTLNFYSEMPDEKIIFANSHMARFV